MSQFDKSYAEYQRVLLLFNESDEITKKNMLFKQLTQILAQMEIDIINLKLPSVGTSAKRAVCQSDRLVTHEGEMT